MRAASKASSAAPGDGRGRVMATVGTSSGNLVERYDFYVYSFTSLHFAASFFPAGDPTSQLLNTAGIFAAGFFTRPLGGWLFGRIADRYGRKRSMLTSVLMMCAGSLMIALPPTHAAIGTAAPASLLLARLLQGLSVGGEYGTAATYMSEIAGRGRRGFCASFQYVTLIGGQLLALLVIVLLQQILSPDEMRARGWRVPFAVGAVAALVALILRRTLEETASSESMRHKEAGSLRGLVPHRRAFLIVLGLTAGGSLFFYTFTPYMQKYLVNTVHMPTATASTLMAAVLVVYMVVQPAFGALSDRIGRKNAVLCFCLLGALGAVPLMTLIGRATDAAEAGAPILAGLLIASFYTSVSGVVKAEMFSAEVRSLGVGLSYALANATFGGTAEYVALWFKSVGREAYFFWYVAAMVCVSLASVLAMPDLRRRGHLEGDGRIVRRGA